MTSRRSWRAFIAVGLALLALAGIYRVAASLRGSGGVAPADLQPWWAAAALGCMAAFAMSYAVAWWMLVSALERRPLPAAPAMRLFLLSWPGRYAPFGLPHYGGRVALAPRFGLSRAAVAASLVYENLFAIASSGGVALALLGVGGSVPLGGVWTAASVAAAAASFLALQPAVMRTIVRIGASRVRRLDAIEEMVLPAGATARIYAVYAASCLMSGSALYCALRAISESGASPLSAVAVYNLAGVAGMCAVLVPGGVGVREGVTVALLAGPAPAVVFTAAVLARLVGIIADALLAGAVAMAGLAGRARLRAGGGTVAPQKAAAK